MSVERVLFFVEEPSMEAALRAVAPKLLDQTPFQILVFQGKKDLLKQLPDRLRGYAAWIPSTYRIVVIVDRDDDDCVDLKARLEGFAAEAGLATRSTAPTGYSVVNRIAIEELEAWYFGDWEAVRAAYPKVNANVPKKASFREPDAIKGGTWEAFERVLKAAGYFTSGLRKIEAARAVASQMEPERNTSPSFGAFRVAVGELRTSARQQPAP